MHQRVVKLPGLRLVRVRKGFTQTELARLSGLHRDTLSHLERGQQGAYPLTAQRLADVLGVRVQELLIEPEADEPGQA